MAVHAADRGLITPAAMENVRAAVRASDASPGSRREVVRITGASPQATRAAIEGGELEQVLDSDRGEGRVADIVVEPSGSIVRSETPCAEYSGVDPSSGPPRLQTRVHSPAL